MAETFEEKEKRFLRFRGDVPEAIRDDYRRMLSEMPRDLYKAVVNHYAGGNGITVAEKIRQIDPSLNQFYTGYTRINPITSVVQYTGSGDDNKTVRSYEDRKRMLFHEIGHAVFSSYADSIVRGSKIREVAATTYGNELRRLGYDPVDPQKKPVADYYVPGFFNGGNMRGAAKEAFCEMLSAKLNGGHHNLSRADGRSINPRTDFPRMNLLVNDAMQGYIYHHVPPEQPAAQADTEKPKTFIQGNNECERSETSPNSIVCTPLPKAAPPP